MHDRVEFTGGEKLAHRLAFDDVEVLKENPAAPEQGLQARLLEPDVVVTVQIVDANNLVAAIEQVGRRRRADESGRPRNENLHFRMSLPKSLYGGQPAARRFKTREGPNVRPSLYSRWGSCFATAMYRGTCHRARGRPSSRATFPPMTCPHTIRPRRPPAEQRARSVWSARSRARMPVPLPAPRCPARCRDSPGPRAARVAGFPAPQ